MCHVWDMSSARKGNNLRMRKRPRELGNYRREDRWTSVAERQQDWLGKSSNPFEVETKMLWVARLVKKRDTPLFLCFYPVFSQHVLAGLDRSVVIGEIDILFHGR